MNRACFLAVILFGFATHALADNPMCVPSNDDGAIRLYLDAPRLPERGQGGDMREDGTTRYRQGTWLALVCTEARCRLVRVALKVKTIHPKNDDYGCAEYQTLHWDRPPPRKGEHLVMMFQQNPLLKEGPVTTWYVSNKIMSPKPFIPFSDRRSKVDVSVRIPTPTTAFPDRISIVSTRRVTSAECTEQQEANQECLRETVRVQLNEGTASQWLTEPWRGSPGTAGCMLGYVDANAGFNRDYLWWVGDLDGDHKPDYLLANTDPDMSGFILYLSSSAEPHGLVGSAGSHWTEMQCD